MDIVSKFTSHLKDVLTRALVFAIDQEDGFVRPEHLLFSLYQQKGSVAAHVLHEQGLKKQAVQAFAQQKHSETKPSAFPTLNDDAQKIIEKAVVTANIYDHRHVGTEHLLISLLQYDLEYLQTFLRKQQLDPAQICEQLSILLKTTTLFPDLEKAAIPNKQPSSTDHDTDLFGQEEEEGSALEDFTYELTTKKAIRTIGPVIGREKEITRMAHILSRRTKNNPILVGEPGVGKTAIVEGLAKRIVEKSAPKALRKMRIFQLDLAGMIAGTMYRGDFEARLRLLIDEIEELDHAILFVDEVHTIMGAGSASGSLDAANILKPALARGSIRCIGATTPVEFKRHIESDGAMERRFQRITVHEPTKKEARSILAGIQSTYEQFHHVRFTNEAMDEIITLADRYLTTLRYPDKAIDLLDEVGASMEAQEATTPVSVERTHVREALMRIRGLSKQDLERHEQPDPQKLRRHLQSRIFGQKQVIDTIVRVLTRPRMQHSRRPRASFLFAGPSGVGKTALAKHIAQTILPHKDAILRLDMSEYREAFSASKLLGAPAGYVGYRDASILSDHLKAHPTSLILFDEMEKAHPDIQHLLLQLLEEGELRDSTGRTIDFSQSIIIMTTNVGRHRFERGSVGFSDDNHWDLSDIRSDLEETFKVELLNRLDQICYFNTIDNRTLTHIVKKQLAPLLKSLANKGVTIDLDARIYRHIHKRHTQKEGVRGILRILEQEIEPLLFQTNSGTLTVKDDCFIVEPSR